MAEPRARARVLAALLLIAGCAGTDPGAPHGMTGDAATPADAAMPPAPDAAGAMEDPAAVRAALLELRYDDGPPPPDPSNRVADDPAAQLFGRRLFFDPRLSGRLIEGDNDGGAATLGRAGEPLRVSCAGCHLPQSGFVDTRSPHRQISLGAEWTARRTPTLLEVAFAPLYNWDGRRDSLWSQAMGVIENHAEFNSGRLFVALQIERLHRDEYEAIFGALPDLSDADRFPQLQPEEVGCVERLTREGAVYDCRGKPGDGADYDGMGEAEQRAVTEVAVNASKAMAAYVRQLRCGPSRFDHWLDGDESALDASEQRGAALFVGRGQCDRCHSGPNLTDGAFHNVGLAPAPVAVAFIDANDRGAADGVAALLADPLNTRGEFSDGERDALSIQITDALIGAFRTPGLRCISGRPSFMHTGQIRTLSQAVAFHDRGGDPPGNYPGRNELTRLGLTETERADLTAFLGALDGEGPEAALLAAP